LKTFAVLCACLSFALFSSCATSTAAGPETGATTSGAAAAPAGKSLYDRLGGMDAIKAVVNDFIDAQAADPKLAHFYAKTDTKYLKGQISDMLCAASGGPCKYTGMDMKDAHEGRKVKTADFETTVGHLVATLNKYKVPQKEQDEVLAVLGPLKKDIVQE
jgi:hemoglobin